MRLESVNHRGLVLLGLLGAVALLSGCPSFAQFQEADVLEKGESKFGVGIGATSYSFDVGVDGDEDIETFTVPQLSVWGRYGLTEKLELHGHIWLPFGATLGGKYQLIGNRKQEGFALSVGGDVGYLTISSGDLETNILDIYIPIYTGYRFSEDFALYLTPKYDLRILSGSSSGTAHLFGGTVGTAIGKDVQFIMEASVLMDSDLGEPVVNGGIGLAF